MTTIVTLVLRKEYADTDPELKTATLNWDVGGWVLAGARIESLGPDDPNKTLCQILLGAAQDAQARADLAEQKLAEMEGTKGRGRVLPVVPPQPDPIWI